MEAVPKLPLISFELKVSPESTHFGPKLKQYISEAYKEDPDSYSNEMHQLESLRGAAVRPTMDESGLNTMMKYFCQLRSIQTRFPMAKGQQAAVTFVWKDLYANMSTSLSDVRFEMACILHNIGVMHTQLGSAEPRTSPESLKSCLLHYQYAAWAFKFLLDNFPQPPGVDVSTDIMRFMQEVCLAVAQECILEKSIQDTKKSSVVGAVATQVLQFYRNSLALLGPSTGTDNIHEIIGTKLYNHWYRYLSFKSSYIGCIVCLYQGMNAEEQQKMGERVAFYQLALDKLVEAKKLTKYIEPKQVTEEALTFTNDVVEGKRKAAKNENEFIYHEEVPDKDVLVDLKPVCLVKPMPINFCDPEFAGTDLFARLIPMGAHEASSMYSEEKAKLLRGVTSRADSKDTEMIEFMSSLQLDQLDVIGKEQKIPQEIVDRCAAMNAKTEIIQSLVESMNSLAEIITDVEHSLAECKSLIQEETTKEKEYQKIMGHRPPSNVQTELSREFHKYQEAHARTNESNQVLHKAMTLHIANLRLLSLPLDQLEHKIPSINNIEGLDRETMAQMRHVVGKARHMQKQRDTLIQQLRDDLNNDDITTALLAGNKPPQEIFAQQIEKHNPKIKIIEQNLAAQENIINKMTSLYASYGESRRLLTDVLRKRDGLINALITSYDTYEELLGKVQKGLEFYKKLSHNVNQLLARLKSTCQVQQEERATLLAKQSGRASATSTPTSVKSDPPAAPLPPTDNKPKLKDYLPYMKSRAMARSGTPQVQPEMMPTEYYPETIYPSTVRPAPVGSEATADPTIPYQDGTVPDPRYYYQQQYSYPEEDTQNYGYNTPYIPQLSSQSPHPQSYTPYYTGTQDNATVVTDSQAIPYGSNQVNQSNQYGGNQTQYPQGANQHPQGANQHPQGTNQHPQGANQYPQGANQYPQGANQYSQASSQYPGQTSQYAPGVNQSQYPGQTEVAPQYPSTSSANPYTNQVNQYGNQGGQYSAASTSTSYPGTIQSVSGTNQGVTGHNQGAGQQYQANQGVVNQGVNQNQYGNQAQTQTNQYGEKYEYNQVVPNQDLSSSFAQMQVTPKPENQFGSDYSQTYYSIQYPQVATPNNATYSHAIQSSNTSIVPSQIPSDYSALNYPYTDQYQSYDAYSQATSYAPTSHPVNTNAATSQTNTATVQSYEQKIDPIALSQLDAIDKPIKSHTSGQALNSFQIPNQPNNFAYTDQSSNSYSQSYQNHPGYTYNTATGAYEYNYGSHQSQDPNSVQSQNQVYTSAGACETLQSPSETPSNAQGETNNQIYYNNPYGYQTMQPNEMIPNSQQVETNYGAHVNQSTYMQSGQQDSSVTYSKSQVSSPTDNVTDAPNFNQQNYQNPNVYQTESSYQNNPGYQNVTNNYQTDQPTYQSTGQYQPSTANYQDSNQSTPGYPNVQTPVDSNYKHVQNIQINYQPEQNNYNQENMDNYQNQQNEQIANNFQNQNYNQPQPAETYNQQPYQEQPVQPKYQNQPETANQPTYQNIPETKPNVVEEKQPISNFDLLSDIDFTVETKPLLPEIKVPQISETAIKKPTFLPKEDPKPQIKEEVFQRPPKRDLFSDPGLLNRFTEEVKGLQKMVDSLTNKTPSGLTLLDSKWKMLQDVQLKENMNRSKTIAMQNSSGNILTEVVPFDDTRLTLKSDPDVYINASFYKQLTSWCPPLVISKTPSAHEANTFWKAVLENNAACIVCLQSEIEMQGQIYWATAKGHTLDLGDIKVTLEDVTCTVHWTERKLSVVGKNSMSVTHFQINVFPAKIACAPIVHLAHRVHQACQPGNQNQVVNLQPAWLHDAIGAGRSCVLALAIACASQARAGDPNLQEYLETACVNLYKHRSNVMEDTKFLADAYRTVLFYAQGVLLSGTTMFSGESVAVPSGASILPPVQTDKPKFSKESFEEMRQSPGMKTGDMKDPLNFLDPLWSLKKK